MDLTAGILFKENQRRLMLRLVNTKKGFACRITDSEIHRPGLALAGFMDLFHTKQIQICGNTELAYLRKLSPKHREEILRRVLSVDIPLIIITNNGRLPSPFTRVADEKGISIFRTPLPTGKLAQLLQDYLDEKFAPRTHIHGSLVDVYGIGVLICGRSGIGKSEVALDLVANGHRLIVDDVVTVSRHAGGVLIGTGNPTLGYHMEIRGVGIVDIQAIYGIRSIRRRKRVEVQVDLVDWDKTQKVERLDLDESTVEIIGETVPVVRLPIYPGKNISVIIEVIALNQLLRIHGHHAARAFTSRIDRKMTFGLDETLDYLGRDDE